MPNITGQLQHIGIPSPDTQKTVDFFASLDFIMLHIATNPHDETQVYFMRLGSIVLEIYSSEDAAQKPGAIDHFAISVSEIDKKYSEIAALGYPILEKGVQQLPFWDNGVRFFTVKGPFGEKVEFCQLL